MAPIERRLRYAAELNPSVRTDLLSNQDTEVSFLAMEAIGEDGSLDLGRTRPVAEVRSGYTYFEDGDVAFAKVTPCFENGKGALMEGLEGGVGFGTTELTVLRPKEGIYARYLSYVVQSESFRQLGAGAMTGAGGLKRVPDDFTRNFKAQFPGESEQQRIANFLDEQTARIDALIAGKKKLTLALDEKRVEAIDNTVLGRDLVADGKALKQLDILGNIPSGWIASRLKYELEYVTSGSRGWADFYADTGAIFIRIGNLTRNSLELDLEDIQHVALPTAAEGTRALVRPGDLLISITAYLGSIAVAPQAIQEAYVSQHVSLARPNMKRALPKWLGYVVLSSIGRIFFELQAYGGTKIQLSLEDIRELPVPLPPLSVQRARIVHLEEQLAHYKNLSELAVESIGRLEEYRSSLISAAVTGQIDINKFQLEAA